MRNTVRICLTAVVLAACGDLDYQKRSLTAPSSSTSLAAWSPCVGLHTPGGVAYPIQMAAVRKLVAAGRMQWVRLGVSVGDFDSRYHADAKAMGLNIINVVQLHDLEQNGWEATFDLLYARYPHSDGDIWGIAGEVTNNNPNVNPFGTVTPEYYLQKFTALYHYVKRKYPNVILSNGPTLGSGGGPRELQWYFDHGLLDLDIVISVNIYSDHAISQYGALFQNERYRAKLFDKRVFVMESGADGGEYHINHIEEFYPRIRAHLNPEMVCWYVMWGGDRTGPTSDNGFGMLSGVESGTYEERPLFRALTAPDGGVQ